MWLTRSLLLRHGSDCIAPAGRLISFHESLSNRQFLLLVDFCPVVPSLLSCPLLRPFVALIWGEFGAGYASQRFQDPTIGTIAGPAFRGMLTWSPTRSLDLHFKAEQIVTEAADTVAGGIKANAFQLGADYELRRNLILSVAGTYERDQFFGQPRSDTVRSIQTELKYVLNRYSTISLQHRYFRRDSNVPSAGYDKHEVGVNVTARY